eukprot:gnl/TRDRNA2_/TRDRNA2_180386_c0_seq1.p1 gnl/TRDRNA2_/TRDRNA2_180386_c0~~gnl/TRDRNA2_/TRDRNA2_180386_c0_seq1.p1  ORF type:complete len:159 (+),score=6.91 gnl/TRDRNA2_/TRDRNA2_180386_c0_seq1:1-477(+)
MFAAAVLEVNEASKVDETSYTTQPQRDVLQRTLHKNTSMRLCLTHSCCGKRLPVSCSCRPGLHMCIPFVTLHRITCYSGDCMLTAETPWELPSASDPLTAWQCSFNRHSVRHPLLRLRADGRNALGATFGIRSAHGMAMLLQQPLGDLLSVAVLAQPL